MNKVAVAAAVLLVIALLALPRAVGSITEARVRERLDVIDANPSAAARLTAYERGWFRSTAKLEVGLAPDAVTQAAVAAGTPLGVFDRLPIVVELAHGPIALLDGVHFGWSKMVVRPDSEAPGVAELTQTLGVAYLFEFRGRTSYRGTLRFAADAPPFELPIDEALLTFSGGALAGSLAGSDLAANAEIASFALASPTGTFAMQGIRAGVDNELRSAYVMPGVASLSVASVSVASPQRNASTSFEAANLSLKSDVDLDATGELLQMRVDYGFESVRIEDSELTDGALAVTVRNLDAAAVEAYGATAAEAAEAGADPAVLAAALGPHLERALRAGPSLTIDPLRFRYDGEPFDGRIELTTNTARLPAAGSLSVDNPLLILGLVNATASLQLSKTLAAQLATLAARIQLAGDPSLPPDQVDYLAEAQAGLMLTLLTGQGVLIEEGDGYKTSLDYTDGELTLNGNPLPFGLP